MTDTAAYYKRGDLGTDQHEMVNHFAEEWVRGDVHTNTIEGYFSILSAVSMAFISMSQKPI